MSSLDLLTNEIQIGLDAQDRRGGALDSKAGVVLGFAAVIVGLSAQQLHGIVSYIGLGLGAATAVLAAAAFIPRSFPTVDLLRLRQNYLIAEIDETKLRLMDTKIAMYEHTQRLLRRKARFVTAATIGLALASILIVAGAMLD